MVTTTRQRIRIGRFTRASVTPGNLALINALMQHVATSGLSINLAGLRELAADPRTHLLVARNQSNRLIGLIELCQVGRLLDHQGWIGRPAVDGHYEERGIDRQLIQAAINSARKLGLHKLYVSFPYTVDYQLYVGGVDWVGSNVAQLQLARA